jgi:hypothetical protein
MGHEEIVGNAKKANQTRRPIATVDSRHGGEYATADLFSDFDPAGHKGWWVPSEGPDGREYQVHVELNGGQLRSWQVRYNGHEVYLTPDTVGAMLRQIRTKLHRGN